MARTVAPMKPVADIRRENLERLLAELAITLDSLAERAETSPVYLSQIRNKAVNSNSGKVREMGNTLARRLEKAGNKPRGWMDREPPLWASEDGTGLPLIPWASLASLHELPPRFVTTLPDDAMVGGGLNFRAGTVVEFDTTVQPRPGSGVLIQGWRATYYVRRYREVSQHDKWIGHAPNAAYRPLDPDIERAKVVAVWSGTRGGIEHL